MKLNKFIYVGVIGILAIVFNTGCETTSITPEKQETVQKVDNSNSVKQEVTKKPEASKPIETPKASVKEEIVQKPEIPVKYYGVQWGNQDNEWVFSDDWVQPEKLNFIESMEILNTCKKGKDSNTQANKEAVQACLSDKFTSKIAK
ncbi:hypothetical protein AB4Z50_34955 [Paenibacillus sp. 2TAB26]|uniref:hypothetical protein n=1 Tax=Paenibacillus sp. 2TAB26 TaxID=3233005 RepID=UPI003F98B611